MKYRTAPGVILTSVCGQYFLITSGETIEINETATFYWKKLEQEASEEDLFSMAEEFYEIEDPEGLKEDIRSLIIFLRMKRLLVRCAS